VHIKRLVPLLDFGRERDTVDLGKVVLTQHTLKNQGGSHHKRPPIDAVEGGLMQEKPAAFWLHIKNAAPQQISLASGGFSRMIGSMLHCTIWSEMCGPTLLHSLDAP
jgi:hypothetical protein